MKKLIQYIRPYIKMMSFGLTIKFIAALADLFIPSLLAKILDEAVSAGSRSQIFFWGGIMLVCAFAACGGNIGANRLAAKSAGRITHDIRRDLFKKISSLSCAQSDKFSIASLISRLTSDTYNVNQMLARMQRLGVRGPILLIGGIAITVTLDPVLTCVLLLMLPLIGIVVFSVTSRSVPVYNNVQKKLDILVRTIQENITGIRVIKALSKTEYETKRLHEAGRILSDEEQKAEQIMAVSNPSTTLILNIGLTLVVIVGAYRVNGGYTQPGTIIAFLSYFTIILNAMLGITRIFTTCSKGAASMKRINEVLDEKEDLLIQSPDYSDSNYHISFENVSFSYNKRENNLQNISFALKRGETLGIIGATGSGKSTIINLLMRFYDPDSGSVRINGQNVNSIPPGELYTKFGVVFQNDFVMGSTIRENIDYFRNLSDSEIERGAASAQAQEFISGFSDSYEHKVTERGMNLSGGQRQRLLLARAFAKKPEILILDDASSALDYATDAKLRHAIAENFSDTTKIISAQRISSIRHADLILVIEDGKIIGAGNHDYLVNNCGVYKEINEAQMGDDYREG